MKLVPETIYKIVNDDGTEVRPATAKKVKEIVCLIKNANLLGDSSPVGNNVAMKIASAILSNYELRKKSGHSPQPPEQTDNDIPAFQDDDPDGLESAISKSRLVQNVWHEMEILKGF